MIQSINDEIRKELANKKHPGVAAMYLESLENKEEIIKLLFSDYFKIIFFIVINTDNEILKNGLKNFKVEKFLEDMDDPILFNKVYEYSKLFNSLSYITKIGILELLETHKQDKIVSEISKLHIFDKIAYSFKYDLDSFTEYYRDYRKAHQNYDDLGISVYISSKLDELEMTDPNKHTQLLLGIIKEYYKWTYFIFNNLNDNLCEEDKVILNFLETQNLDFIIEYAKTNFEVQTRLLSGYLYYTHDEAISKKIVEDYWNEYAKSDIIKKLKYEKK